MTKREKFLKLVSGKDTEIANEIAERRKNRDMLRASGRIALKVRSALRELGMSQKDLADNLGVTPQYVSKLVKGKENFTLDTIVKLQNVLSIEILASSKKETPVVQMTIKTEHVYNRSSMIGFSEFEHQTNMYTLKTVN